jgi:hypothetical protein
VHVAVDVTGYVELGDLIWGPQVENRREITIAILLSVGCRKRSEIFERGIGIHRHHGPSIIRVLVSLRKRLRRH